VDGRLNKEDAKVLKSLAGHIVGFDPATISDHALHTVKMGITDTIGVTLAGVTEACTQIMMDVPGVADASGPCLIFGTNRKVSALDATLVNGVSSHALDFDDFSDVLGGHQSVPLVPVLFALAEKYRKTGQEIVNAYTVGFEVEHRFAMAVHPYHYDKGWHPTATLGIFGTVAAAARLLGLNQEKTATALAIATSMASGLKSNFGTMTKPLHVGHSGRSGLLAVLLAARDFTANHASMEHHQGFFALFNGDGNFTSDALVEPWSGPLALELPTIGIKQFPCCGSTHQAITAMINLKLENDLSADDVLSVVVHTHPRRLLHTNNPYPESVLEAKFSLQYTVARALTDGAVRLADFKDDAFRQPNIKRLLEITKAIPFGNRGAPKGEPWDAEIKVTTQNGKVLKNRVNNMVGRSGDNPMTIGELKEKFIDCSSCVLTEGQSETAFQQLIDLENLENIGLLIKNLEFTAA